MTFKPMLAANVMSPSELRYPLLASCKYDGVRAIIKDGIVLSRSGKPIPNRHVQELFKEYEFLDGELLLGDPTDRGVFRRTASAVMSKDGRPDVYFYVFDHIKLPLLSYLDRLQLIYSAPNVIPVTQTYCENALDVFLFEDQTLRVGYEGVILRDPHAQYKSGRSSLRSQQLLKLKRFTDAEAVIIGATELQRKDGTKDTGLLGAFMCKTDSGIFTVGSGYTDDDRSYYWVYKDDYIGRILKYKYLEVGGYELPRHPVFLGIRDEIDI